MDWDHQLRGDHAHPGHAAPDRGAAWRSLIRLARGRPPSGRIAFVDLDETLVAGNSARIYARALRERGRLRWWQLVYVSWLLLRYRLALLDMVQVTEKLVRRLAGQSEAELRAFGQRLFDERIAPLVHAEALDRIAAHRQQGDAVVLLSASSPYVVAPAARHVDADGYLCTFPEVQHGTLTGHVVPPVCYGEGKLVWARRMCTAAGVDLAACTFYTDSYADRPVLEAVGHPVAVNPDPRLRRLAHRRGWPIEHFTTPVGDPALICRIDKPAGLQ